MILPLLIGAILGSLATWLFCFCMSSSYTRNLTRELSDAHALNDRAWGIIANASDGDWDQQSAEWRSAAIRWRDDWHDVMP